MIHFLTGLVSGVALGVGIGWGIHSYRFVQSIAYICRPHYEKAGVDDPA